MNRAAINRLEHLMLITVPLGLSVIGLGYLVDTGFYPGLFGFAIDNISGKNVYRAFGALYISLGLFWLSSLRIHAWRKSAVLSIAFLMMGLAMGRVISLFADGTPHGLVMFYLALEIFCLIQAVTVYQFKYAGSQAWA